MDKQSLRNQMKALRSVLLPEDRKVKDEAIALRARKVLPWQDVKRIHVYRSDASLGEVDTSWVEPYVHSSWPHIEVVVGEPMKDVTVPEGLFDLIIVPLLGFDDEMNRIGYGAGWYDRFLAGQPQAASVGLAYESQHVTKIDTESHDVRLSRVITDQRVYD